MKINNLTFTPYASIWKWWVRDKETLAPLSSITQIQLFSDRTEMSFVVEDHHLKNENAVIYLERIR